MQKNNEDTFLAEIPGLSEGSGVQTRGKQRALEIVRIATDVFAFEGYRGFTMRQIASLAGIGLKNLQHYFGTRDALVRAVVLHRLNVDLQRAAEVVNRKDLSSEQRFLAFCDYSIRGNTSGIVRGFQFELWALATRDPFMARCRDQLTSAHCRFISDLIRDLCPHEPAARRLRKAGIVLTMLQGVALLRGDGVQLDMQIRNIEKSLKAAALRVVLSHDA